MNDALVLREQEGAVHAAVEQVDEAQLPEGDVLLDVLYSSLNYKDALAVTGRGKIVRAPYPFVPGIDLVGRVVASEEGDIPEGALVIATGWGLGETRWGGYARRQRVRAHGLVPLPESLSPQDAMVIGTAGLTAMLSVMALEAHGVDPACGEVVVTGASGGVGSMAVALLAALGYTAVASTGTEAAHDYLKDLGAARILPRDALSGGPAHALESARWAGAVDSVGGNTLAAILAQLGRHGSVAACGLAGGHRLPTTVYPFILRGVNLLGIDSNTCPADRRSAAWNRLAHLLTPEHFDRMCTRVIGLDEIPQASRDLLANKIQGRVVVDGSR